MNNVQPTLSNTCHLWYLVCLNSGATAVVSLEDLGLLMPAERVFSAVRVTAEAGRDFELQRAKAAFMSANHRIKAGESGGVG